ncbi:MAG TPA: DUF5060 domain-containing protein, partial [Thermoanaerobaculia bacterium]|nr:DUF5060 domain-containing protein [Thermoanaerobaculia bacterium]
MPRNLFLLTLLFGACLLSGPEISAASTARFDTAEVALHSARRYDGAQGSPNPFTDVSLSARVTAPSGRTYTVDGFFDGDGTGGQSGDVWKLRVFADEPGTWSWTTASSDSSLDRKAGTFDCAGTLSGTFGKGPIVADPEHPRSFRYREGPPVFLVGKFLDEAAQAPLRYTHVLLSEVLTDADRQALLSHQAGLKVNKMNVYLANKGDYAGTSPTTPWLGSAGANDKTRFDLARWRLYERWVLALRDAGIAADLWFFADDSDFGSLPDADRKRLIAYGMARLSGYVHTRFILFLEWQEALTAAQVNDSMGFLQGHNPWRRLASIHSLAGDVSFPTASWADFTVLQVDFEAGFPAVHANGVRNRSLATKPLMIEEFTLGQEDSAGRSSTWGAFTAGAAGVGTGAFLPALAQFVATVPFERMDPADGLVLAGSALGLAEPGRTYVFYLPYGGTITADLAAARGPFLVRWFDPRAGTFQTAASVAGGGPVTFTAPSATDWVLSLASTQGGAQGGFFSVSPCRLYDTRRAGNGPVLAGGEVRIWKAAGTCGIPAGATALSANVTVTGSTGQGALRLWPGGTPPTPPVVNFGPGQTRANTAILSLAA